MSVLSSKCAKTDMSFRKEFFSEVAQNLVLFTDEEWESEKESHKKVSLAVYVRTDIDNLVLTFNGDFAKKFDIPAVVLSGDIYPHLLVDSGFVCGKELLDLAFNTKSEEALKRLAMHSVCFPVGAVETSENYVLVFNVIMSSELLKDSEIQLNQGFYFYPIPYLKNTEDFLQREILKSLVIVESEG